MSAASGSWRIAAAALATASVVVLWASACQTHGPQHAALSPTATARLSRTSAAASPPATSTAWTAPAVSRAAELTIALPTRAPADASRRQPQASTPPPPSWLSAAAGLMAAALSLALWLRGGRRPGLLTPLALAASSGRRPLNGKRLLVLGGSGYLGRRICRYAVKMGYKVTSLSRRGAPADQDALLSEVSWRTGDATQQGVIASLVAEGCDGLVHCIGLLFDTQSGLAQLNTIVSGSKSLPDSGGTYDKITRLTGETAVYAVLAASSPKRKLPVAFVSAAEAGWPDVPGGRVVEALVPDFLKRYLAAKRAVEARLMEPCEGRIRPLIFRPSLMWDWGKLDVLPVIPVFALASAAGVPFVDRPMFVDNIAKAVVAGIGDDTLSGVLRFNQMDELASRDKWEF